MISVAETIAKLHNEARIIPGSEPVALKNALGRILADDIVAGIDVPPADNSGMDGFALRHADCPVSGEALPVSQRIVAGTSPAPLEAGTAARIFTGAEIPAGADTVIMQEHCEATDDGVIIHRRPFQGANIRPRAQDVSRGERVLPRGQRLRPQDLGLIASLGIPEFSCYRPLRIAVISTGSELVEPGQAIRAGQIYNSNRYLIHSTLRGWGCEVLDQGIVTDEPGAVRGVFEQAATGADLVISSGGVSVGEEDHVKNVVSELGSLDLWRVAIKPGKPFAFGRVGDTPFLGLPGNPGSVWVTLLILVRPYVLRCAGRNNTEVATVSMPACFEQRGGSREEYLRARSGPGGVEIFPQQSSGMLKSASWGDGLVVQRIEQDIVAGDAVEFLSYAALCA